MAFNSLLFYPNSAFSKWSSPSKREGGNKGSADFPGW